MADGRAHRLNDGRTSDWSPSWSTDARTLYFVLNRGGSMDLWHMPIAPDGTPGVSVRLTTGLQIRHAVFSPDGTKLVYSKGQRVANLWRVPIVTGRPAMWADAQQLTSDGAFIEFADLSRDGKTLVLSSNRTGTQHLWTMPAGGGDML